MTLVRVVIIGPYPPPRGGISVHIFRLAKHLASHGLPYVVSDISKRRGFCSKVLFWARVLAHRRGVVYHFHDISVKRRIFIGLLGALGWKVVLTVHGDSLKNQLLRLGGARRYLLRWAICHTSYIVAVNPAIAEIVRALGDACVTVLPAYLPPLPEEVQEMGRDLREFCRGHWPLLSANAFQIAFYQGRDLYGLDTSIELCALLRQRYPRVGFLFCLPAVGEPEYLEKMRGLIAARGLEDNLLFVVGRPEEFYAVLQASTVFIRPTLTDGDAVSIREALHFGVPAVASDVCPRPEGTLLYRVGDLQDLYERVVYAIEHRDELRAAISRLPQPDYFTPLLEIYRRLAGGHGEV